MKELNELVELANHLDGESWEYSRTTPYSRGYITGRNGRTIVQTLDGEVPASVCRFIEMADPAAILAIAEAFRAMEKRAEAAEADTRRMDWLCAHCVEVRQPLMYGSHAMFHAQQDSEEWDLPHHTTLREQVDAALRCATLRRRNSD